MAASSRSADDRSVSLLAKDQYFREIAHLPRLTIAQEQRYLDRIGHGNIQRQHAHPDQWRLSLARDARARLTEVYQPMVVHLAQRFHHFCHSMVLLDLIQEGNLGLLNAFDRCGLGEHPKPFRKLASLCVRSAIINAIHEQDHLIRGTASFHRTLAQVRKVTQQLQATAHVEPSLEEVAAVMGHSEREVRQTVALAERETVKSLPELLERWERWGDDADEAALRLLELYAPTPRTDTERQVVVREQLRVAMQGLSDRQRQVLCWRYGLDEGEGPYSVPEIARRLGCNPITVGSLERVACQKLARLLAVEVRPEGSCYELRAEARACLVQACYTWQEATARLGCSRATLARYVKAGKVPVVRRIKDEPGWLYPQAAIERLAAERRGQVA
ncbi:MAG TPA: sigma-70 family RNA polymerase sigma factor [Ktedonobacteraceae bacterium]|nr:sigma-70 family RNA polymerase sigma factor [Ktedonobacteraceae bacterium]